MKLVKQMQFLDIFFDEQKRILLNEWRSGNIDIEENNIKEIIIELVAIIKEYSPIYFIADSSNREAIITVEIQNWIASIINEALISVGIKIVAVIFPKELIAHLSTEQTIDEIGESPYKTVYFNSKDEVLAWVKSLEKA